MKVPELHNKINRLIELETIDTSVVETLAPDGSLVQFEDYFWDYKRATPDHDDTPQQNYAIAEVVKDIVAFHNSYGGYIIFGVDDNSGFYPNNDPGWIDTGDLQNRIEGATRRKINVRGFNARLATNDFFCLFIPKRGSYEDVVTFAKASPPHPKTSKRCYNALDTYLRERDKCKPAAQSADDWKLIHSPRNWGHKNVANEQKPQTNLPARASGLTNFVGREAELTRLREWVSDKRSPTRVITGIGGLGKTALAYQFCEEIIDVRSNQIERLFWMSAKEASFSPIRGKLEPTGKRDYTDVPSLFSGIVDVLATSVNSFDGTIGEHEIDEAIAEALTYYKTLLVIDDLDSLDIEDQRVVLHRLDQIFSRTVNGIDEPSRLLVTTRTDQALAPSQILKLSGLAGEDYARFVEQSVKTLGIADMPKRALRELQAATSGSPLFTASLLRLVKTGTALNAAIAQWKGADGEDARAFAFKRELESLTKVPARVLYAICLLRRTSVIELASVLETGERTVRDSVAELQSFYLADVVTEKGGDVVLSAPDEVIQTRSVLRAHIRLEAPSIDKACAALRKSENAVHEGVSIGIAQISRFLQDEDYDRALHAARTLTAKFPNSGDAACMLACVIFEAPTGTDEDADRWFEKAYSLQSRRAELVPRWATVKRRSQDWFGLRQVISSQPFSERTDIVVIDMYGEAIRQCIRIARERSDLTKAREIAEEAIRFIAKALVRVRFDERRFDQLRTLVNYFSSDYFSASLELFPEPRDGVYVTDSTCFLVDHNILHEDYINTGVERFEAWARAVLRQRTVTDAEFGMAQTRAAKLLRVADRVERRKSDLANAVRAAARGVQHTLRVKLVPLAGERIRRSAKG